MGQGSPCQLEAGRDALYGAGFAHGREHFGRSRWLVQLLLLLSEISTCYYFLRFELR